MKRNNVPDSVTDIERESELSRPFHRNSAGTELTPSKLRKGLLRSHQIVLRALEVANLRLNRVVTVAEIAECMLPSEVAWIGQNYAKELCMLIPSIMGLLTRRGLVFSPGRIGKHRYYGSTSVLDPEKSPLPEAMSRRRRVLGIVYRAVEHFGRAVRTGDVLDFVASKQDEVGIDPEMITRDILNLSATGEITIVGTVRGDEKGTNLYLPSDLNPDSHQPAEPLTWLEEVAQTFTELWQEELNRATDEGRRPRPLASGAIRERVAAVSHWPSNLDDPRILPNALLQLAQTDDAIIRKVERQGQQSLMWAPMGISDEALDLGDAYVSDAERIAEAVGRGCRRMRRPVNVRDVKDEIEMDPCLAPAGRLKLRSILSNISKEKIDGGDGTRRDRITRRCFCVGKVNGHSYYCNDAEAVNEACSYVRFRQLELRWSSSATLVDSNAYLRCSLPTVAVGRAMLVKAEAELLRNDIDKLLQESAVDGATHREAELLSEQLNGVTKAATDWLTQKKIEGLDIPQNVSLHIPGWTAAELLQALKPIYPAAKELKSPQRLTTLVSSKIRQFLNPKFENRFSKVPHKASEYLYDRTDALLFAATRWGGHECRMQAMMVKSEIGLLRDPRFIFPALSSDVMEERLIGVAGLAFLWSDEGNALLRSTALNDIETGLRQSALWAYGFAGGSDAEGLLRERASSDPDVRTRAFFMHAMVCLESNDGLWWKV
jgi:hypothetical protein